MKTGGVRGERKERENREGVDCAEGLRGGRERKGVLSDEKRSKARLLYLYEEEEEVVGGFLGLPTLTLGSAHLVRLSWI